MKKAVWLLVIFALMSTVGCNNAPVSKDSANMFLQGVQEGDKNKMFTATNLTTDIVNDSREKLVHPAQYKQTDQQRKDSEYMLRISGEIDFFSAKIKKLLPKSANFQIFQSKAKSSTGDTKNAVHFVKITYGNKDESMSDKTSRTIKEMVLHLQESSRMVNGRLIHEFSFNSEDFEKIADRNFEVLSYF